MSLHCDLCGLDFDPDCTEASCGGCPLKRNCQHISCPRCGYAILPEPSLIRWLRKIGKVLQGDHTGMLRKKS